RRRARRDTRAAGGSRDARRAGGWRVVRSGLAGTAARRAGRVRLPVPAKEILDCVAADRAALAALTRRRWCISTCGTATCSWESDGEATLTLSGLVDGERWLYGDPLVDLASPALFRDMLAEPGHPFLRGYLSVRPFEIDDAARRRLW